MSQLFAAITSHDNLLAAFRWLMHRRRNYNDSWWDLRIKGETRVTAEVALQLVNGEFRLGAIREFRWNVEGQIHKSWGWEAIDALVLRAIAQVLMPFLKIKIGLNVTNLKGCGGAKGAIRQVAQQLPQYHFVMRTDVKDYYQTIDHSILREQLYQAIDDSHLLALLEQYIDSSIYFGGVWRQRWGKGVCTGCPLAPLLGALYLHSLDQAFACKNNKFFYVRYMDDILILAKTRWHLKEAISTLNAILDSLKQTKHPDKTFIGRVDHGFNFLGYYYENGIWSVAKKTIEQCTQKIARLLEQDTSPRRKEKSIPKYNSHSNAPKQGTDRSFIDKKERVWKYLVRFLTWTASGLTGRISLVIPNVSSILAPLPLAVQFKTDLCRRTLGNESTHLPKGSLKNIKNHKTPQHAQPFPSNYFEETGNVSVTTMASDSIRSGHR